MVVDRADSKVVKMGSGLKAGRFYRTCASFPVDINDQSPLKAHGIPLPDSPVKGVPIRVSENTSMWHIPNVKVSKPCSCYLVSFDPLTDVGVIFLGSSSSQVHPHRFVNVHGGEGDPIPQSLKTVPLRAFPASFSLNLSHPLRVKLVYMGSAHLNSIKRMVVPIGLPSPVGIGPIDSRNPAVPAVSLEPESEAVFWALQKAYHKTRPPWRNAMFGGGFGPGGGSGGGAAGAGGSGGGDGGAGGSAGGASDGVTSLESTADAPWGRIGNFRIGIDISLLTEEFLSDEEDDDDEEGVSDVLDGIVYVFDPLPFEDRYVVCS